jgi:hypothetical protein
MRNRYNYRRIKHATRVYVIGDILGRGFLVCAIPIRSCSLLASSTIMCLGMQSASASGGTKTGVIATSASGSLGCSYQMVG